MGVVIAQGEAIHGLTHVHPIWVGILIVEAVALGIPWLLTTKILIGEPGCRVANDHGKNLFLRLPAHKLRQHRDHGHELP